MLETLAPIIVSVVFFMIPLVLILTKHQHRMALLFHDQNNAPERQRLEHTVQELAFLAHQQDAAITELKEKVQRLEAENSYELPKRLNNY